MTDKQQQNVDEILTGNNPVYDDTQEAPVPDLEPEDKAEPEPEHEPETNEEPETDEKEVDEYGNEQEKKEPKMYTEDEVNERINKAMRERLARMKQQDQPTEKQQEQVQEKAEQSFEYDENSNKSWEQQLESFIENTMTKVQQRQTVKQREQLEQQRQQEFQDKLYQGMSKFSDFEQVVSDKPITQEMVYATRGMKDPAAFLYAASKNHSDDLTRISQLQDPIQQITEMTRLENKMRVNRGQTKAPAPPSKTPQGKASVGEENVDALIQKAAQKKAKQRGWMS